MTYFPKPERLPETRLNFEVLNDLVERYRKSLIEAEGMLHAIAGLHGKNTFDVDAIRFLILVGDEREMWEPVEELRKSARKILFRRVLPQELHR